MLTFINNIPLTAHYDSSYAVSTIRSNCILSLHLPQGLPLYVVDVVAPVPSIQDPFRATLVVHTSPACSHELILCRDWRKLLYGRILNACNHNLFSVAGAKYPLSVMPDARHPSVEHGPPFVFQLNMHDIDGLIIPPWAVADKLRPGTLVLIQATPKCWVFNEATSVHKVRCVGLY
jgi:hypothetical protein